jgi:phosphoglycerate kinase
MQKRKATKVSRGATRKVSQKKFLTLDDINVKGKRVLVRVDFNVPLGKDSKGRAVVKDDGRIRAALPTIKELLAAKPAALILVSHLGRPTGVEDKCRLASVAQRLSVLLKKNVITLDDCVGPAVAKAVVAAPKGSVILLENVRFHPEEEKNTPAFARQLASLADVYVDDAFGSAHRAHASVEGVTHYLPSAAGRLLEKEIVGLSAVLETPPRPFVAVLGGAKVSDKIGVITNLLKSADAILIGGAMMFTFLAALGRQTGKSLVEKDKLDLARKLLTQAKGKIILPVDTIVAKDINTPNGAKVVRCDAMPADLVGVDIGPETAQLYGEILDEAKTIVWNGPMGVFEVPAFSQGTLAIAHALARNGGLTVVGGGESGEAVRKAGVAKRITHVSTGGGASLEFLEGKTLPGVAALEKSAKKTKR